MHPLPLRSFRFGHNSKQAFLGSFQFIQALAAASAFFYSVYVGLMYQLLILVVFMLVGTACFLYLEVKYAKKFPIGEES
jgi:hypothetical protein